MYYYYCTKIKFNLDFDHAPSRPRKPNFMLNLIAREYIFSKHINYQCPNDFSKFSCNRIIYIEVIKEII